MPRTNHDRNAWLIGLVEKMEKDQLLAQTTLEEFIKHSQSLSDLIIALDDQELVSNQETFLRLGGHVAVVRAITSLSGLENGHRAAEHAIRVLTNASYHNETLRMEISKVGGIDSILAAMKTHQNEQPVQLQSLKALHDLCRNAAHAESFVNTPNVTILLQARTKQV